MSKHTLETENFIARRTNLEKRRSPDRWETAYTIDGKAITFSARYPMILSSELSRAQAEELAQKGLSEALSLLSEEIKKAAEEE